jgi:hypothetical protein
MPHFLCKIPKAPTFNHIDLFAAQAPSPQALRVFEMAETKESILDACKAWQQAVMNDLNASQDKSHETVMLAQAACEHFQKVIQRQPPDVKELDQLILDMTKSCNVILYKIKWVCLCYPAIEKNDTDFIAAFLRAKPRESRAVLIHAAKMASTETVKCILKSAEVWDISTLFQAEHDASVEATRQLLKSWIPQCHGIWDFRQLASRDFPSSAVGVVKLKDIPELLKLQEAMLMSVGFLDQLAPPYLRKWAEPSASSSTR